MANEYVTLNDLKTAMRVPLADTTQDTELQLKLTAASRRVDKDCGRRHGFWQDSVVVQRIYKPRHTELLAVDDISTATGLIVETGRGTSWSAVDSNSYEGLPENALVDGRPYEQLRRVLGYWPMWDTTRVRVTAKFGWAAIPEEIQAATIIMGVRLARRKDSPEGVKGFADLGIVRLAKYDWDYDALIADFIRDVK